MQLVGRLDHPNVVRAFDADRLGEVNFIAMEYVAGQTLQHLLEEKGAVPPADVVYFASQAADGLAHAHARGVLHRDIKPSNLLLTEARTIKILDFGLGTLLEKEDLPTELTAAGITVGTPDYISPEQARMLKLDGRSDLYSLGCTMYHLISGQLPFKGESSMDCIVGRITGHAVPISEVKPGLPPRLVQSIEKLMATNPDDRYQTADEAAAALRSLLRPKNAAPVNSAPKVAAAEPVPVQKVVTKPEAPPPPLKVGVSPPRPTRDSLRAVKTGPGTKVNRVLAASAVAAVSLIALAIVLTRSSKEVAPASPQSSVERPAAQPATDETPSLPKASVERPAPQQGSSSTKNAAAPIAVKADVRTGSLVIENPKEGSTVGGRVDLTGRIESGWPVIFIQANIPGQPWWCQAPVEKVEGQKFTTNVVFGDDFTPSGMKFRVAGIVARTREEALKFTVGSKEQTLPQGLPRSAVVTVTHQ